MQKKCLLFILSVFLLIGCSTPRLVLNHENFDEKLNLKMNYASTIDQETKDILIQAAEEFSTDYTSENHMFDVVLNEEAEDNYISVDIKEVDYVTGGTQVASTIISLAGVGTLVYTLTNPDLGFTAYWYWLPQYSITSKLYLSSDINDNSQPVVRSVGEFHGFKGIEEQRQEMSAMLKDFLFDTMKELELKN